MSLQRAKRWNGLDVCAMCGWPVAGPFDARDHNAPTGCPWDKAGQVASRLARAVPGTIRSTKFGYGTGGLSFSLDDAHVLFEVRQNGGISLRDLHLLDDLTIGQAAGLVVALREWKDKAGL